MRYQYLKLTKGKSTKAERVFAEMLKRNRVPFRAKVKVNGREVDFLIGNFAIEINGHDQIITKNSSLLENGYIPFHFTNREVLEDILSIELQIKKLWHDKLQQN